MLSQFGTFGAFIMIALELNSQAFGPFGAFTMTVLELNSHILIMIRIIEDFEIFKQYEFITDT